MDEKHVKNDPSATYALLEQAFKNKGYEVRETVTPETVDVSFTSPAGAQWNMHADHIWYPGNSEEVREISIYKNKGYSVAQKAGFPVPFTYKIEEAVDNNILDNMLRRYTTLIVKPEDSSLGKGLTIGITTRSQLTDAIAAARLVSSSVLVQQQVTGQEIRFTVIEGKVVAALLRETARVVGDGVSTIATLIQKENERRSQLVFEVISYPPLDASIVGEDLLNSTVVPANNEVIELASSTMIRGGCSIYNVLDTVHPTYSTEVEKLVAKIGASFIVVDVFCSEYTVEASPDNHWLIEFNTAPVLKLFYACRDGRHFDIVPRLVDMIDTRIHTS